VRRGNLGQPAARRTEQKYAINRDKIRLVTLEHSIRPPHVPSSVTLSDTLAGASDFCCSVADALVVVARKSLRRRIVRTGGTPVRQVELKSSI
jgi:hypothetical protein